jgi:hypothetical protein
MGKWSNLGVSLVLADGSADKEERCPDLATAKDVGLYLDFYTDKKKWSDHEFTCGVTTPRFVKHGAAFAPWT